MCLIFNCWETEWLYKNTQRFIDAHLEYDTFS